MYFSTSDPGTVSEHWSTVLSAKLTLNMGLKHYVGRQDTWFLVADNVSGRLCVAVTCSLKLIVYMRHTIPTLYCWASNVLYCEAQSKAGIQEQKAQHRSKILQNTRKNRKEESQVLIANDSCILPQPEIKESKNWGYNHVSTPCLFPPPLHRPNPSISAASIFWVVICWLHVIFTSAVSLFFCLTQVLSGAHTHTHRHTYINGIHT